MPPRLYPLFDRLFTVLARFRPVVFPALLMRWFSAELLGHRITVGGLDHGANGEAWLMRQIAPRCRTFIDVGANVGAWSELMLSAAPDARAVLYEPSRIALKRLEEAFDADDRVQIVEAAVADAPGRLTFYEEHDAGETASLLAGHSQADATARDVRVVTIDDELQRLGISHVDLLKIDAEGFDLRVLHGARRSLLEGRIDTVQFEYNRPWALAGATLAAAQAFLSSCAMELYVLRDGSLRTINLTRLGELFTYINCVALGPPMREHLGAQLGGDALG